MRSKRSTFTLADRFRNVRGSQRQRTSSSPVRQAKGRQLKQRNTGPVYRPKSSPVQEAKGNPLSHMRNRGPVYRKPNIHPPRPNIRRRQHK